MAVSLRTRGLILLTVTGLVLAFLYLWRGPDEFYFPVPEPGKPDYRLKPPPNVLGHTWYGPILLMLIPAALVWTSLAAKSAAGRVVGIIAGAVVAAVCVFFIAIGRSVPF